MQNWAMKSNRKSSGFTLIEVLVVISILAVLMGLVSVLISKSAKSKEVFNTKTLITTLRTAVDRYRVDFRRFPPMNTTLLTGKYSNYKGWKGLGVDNDTNMSAECLYVALVRPDISAPLSESDLSTGLGNTDEDAWSTQPPGTNSEDAFEILDSWGNPIIYIDKNNYDKVLTVINARGDPVDVQALQLPGGSGQYYNESTYQLISLGEDGEQTAQDDPIGTDDLYNFDVKEE